jgi:VWFA-related protein
VVLAVLFCGIVQAATVESQMITKSVPATGSCSPIPTATTSFLTTDTAGYLYFILRGVKVGDVVATEWTAPDGSIPTPPSGPYPAETAGGDFCYKEKLTIAGDVGAKSPGTWRVRAYVNGTLMFTLTFTINAPATTGGLTVKINQVITSACPKITVVASVTDSSGKPVTGLSASNFTLKEDGTTQTTTVSSTGTGGGTALSLAVVIDHSGSVSGQPLTDEKAAAKALVAQLGASDAVAVFGFGDTVESVLDFTTDKTRINSAIDGIGGSGSTALYKAVVTVAQKLAPRSGRKAIVLMTDGEDTVGGSSIQDAINQAKLAGAPIFPVGFGSVDTAVLTRLATETGGTYTPAANSSSLLSILQNIGAVIAAQYEISYTSSSPSSSHSLSLTAQSGSNSSVAVTQSVTACQSSGSAVTLTVENTTAASGATVDVPVTLTATTAPSGFQYDLAYDNSKLTFVQAKQGDQTKAANKDISTNALSSSSLRVLAAGLNQGLIGNGTVVLMNFRLNSAFSSGAASLTCSNAQSTDANSRAITPTTCQSGTLTVRASCSCDVNGDGSINVSDVQLIVNQALGIVSNRCDINADGQTNVLDVQMVVNATLGLGCK